MARSERLPWFDTAEPLWADDPGVGVPVAFHGREVLARGTGEGIRIVRSCEVLGVDLPEPLTPFERTQAQYEGVDRRSLPTNNYDDDATSVGPLW